MYTTNILRYFSNLPQFPLSASMSSGRGKEGLTRPLYLITREKNIKFSDIVRTHWQTCPKDKLLMAVSSAQDMAGNFLLKTAAACKINPALELRILRKRKTPFLLSAFVRTKF